MPLLGRCEAQRVRRRLGERLHKGFRALSAKGLLRTSARGPQLHHKLSIIDDAVVTGSANWTQAAWEKNVELLLLLLPPRRGREAPVYFKAYLGRHRELWALGESG